MEASAYCITIGLKLSSIKIDCLEIKNFWFNVSAWLAEHGIHNELSIEDILFGLRPFEGNDFLNKVIFYGKLYVYNTKYSSTELLVNVFLNNYEHLFHNI